MKQELQKKSNSSNKELKQLKVDKIFTKVSRGYDLMNDIMSLGLHRIWKEEFINMVQLDKNYYLLDLATGSGDLLELIKKKCDCTCIGFDSNIEMIKQAKKQVKKNNVYFINGRAELLPFKKNRFDIVTVSFGLRNFSDIDQSLKEIKRIIKKGGKFYCLEFSQINNRSLRELFNVYSKLIPFYGKILLNNKEAYSYLVQSIKEFPNQILLTKKLLKVGFKNIEVIDILDGIASIHICEL